VALPGRLDELSERWGLTLGPALPGGSASYVVRATRADGSPCVLKVVVPGVPSGAEVLGAADGIGYVRLLARDEDALLLEELGPSMERRSLEPHEALEALAATLLEAWRVPLAAVPPDEVPKAVSLHEMVVHLSSELGSPCPPSVVQRALTYAERRAAASRAEVVVHGDPHPSNALQAPGSPTGWRFVDPEGFRCDPAYDLGVVLRDWTSRLTGPDPRAVLESYCATLAAASGVEEQAIWEWGFLERVSTGLFVMSIGSPALGRRFLDSAERLL